MKRSLSITVYPSSLDGEYLSVSDALHQVLDLVAALENVEDVDSAARKIIWRLTEAHTNSPPFTVTTEAYPVDPVMSIGLEADRVAALFQSGLKALLQGTVPDWLDLVAAAPVKRLLKRNQFGVGRTEIIIGDDILSIVPTTAKRAIVALEQLELDSAASTVDLSRTEYGSVEGLILGLTQWNGKRALTIAERLSNQKVTCVLSSELAEELGRVRKWEEAWEGRRLLVTGALHYGQDGTLKRIDAEDANELPWTDVSLANLRGIDVLEGRTVSEHISLLREGWEW